MPRETAERDQIARTVFALCQEAEEADEAYAAADAAGDDELAESINDRNAKRLDEIARLVSDLADRPVRNLQDVERRTSVLLCYFKARWGDDPIRDCPFIRSLERINEFARASNNNSSLVSAVLALPLLR